METDMRMKAIALTMTLVAGASVAKAAQTEMLKADQRRFEVVYASGDRETIVVLYEGWLSQERWQTGKSSKPLEGHPIDNRKCHWKFRTWVKRRAYAIHRHSGRQTPLEEFNQIFAVESAGDRGPDKWYEVTYHRTYGDSMGAFRAQLAANENRLQAAFDRILAEDRERAERHLEEILGGTSVVVRR
jgi:hypothetical protein